MIDKATFPRDKICGDGIGPDAVAEVIGLRVAEIFVDKVPANRITLISPKGRRIEGVAPRAGFVIRRYEFDNALVERALSLGYELVQERVESIEFGDKGFILNDKVPELP